MVPRTVAAIERITARLTRRVEAPMRALGERAAAFADRMLGNWTEGRRERAAPPMPSLAASRVGASTMQMPQPWYTTPKKATPPRGVQVVSEAEHEAPPSAAERGATIPLTPLTAPPEPGGAAEARVQRT